MANSNGKITAPVGISDIRSVLGVSSADLGTLCQSSKINLWAKYKPVRLYQVVDTTDQYDYTNLKWKSSATWWKGLSGEFAGITPPSAVSTISQLIALYNGGNNGWVYNRPTGSIHPFRLTDFAEYNHRATPAMQDFHMPSEVVYNGRFSASALMSMPDANGDYISLGDFTNLNVGDLYWGVWIVKADGTPTNTRATADLSGTAGVTINLEGSGNVLNNNTDYKAYPFLCNKVLHINDTSNPSGMLLYPCPNLNPVSFRTIDRNQTANISIDAKYKIGSTTVIYTTTDNGNSTAYTNCYLFIMPMTYWNNPGANTSHAVAQESSFTLSANSTHLKTFTVTAGNYFLYATFNNGTYTRKTNILQSIPDSQ